MVALQIAHIISAYPEKLKSGRKGIAEIIEKRVLVPSNASKADFEFVIELLQICGPHLMSDDESRLILEPCLNLIRDMLVDSEGSSECRVLGLYILELQACGWQTRS